MRPKGRLACGSRAGVDAPQKGGSTDLSGQKDYIEQKGAQSNQQTQTEGQEEKSCEHLRSFSTGDLEENGHALRYYATERAVSAE